MTKYTDNLWNDLTREHGAALEQAGRPGTGKTRRPGSRVIAGGTLALAVAGTALGLGLTSTGGTVAAGTTTTTTAGGTTQVVTAAYTITEKSNGSVLVQVNQEQSIAAADAKLSSMGINEKVSVFPKPGAATVSGPVTCTPVDGASKQDSVQVLLGTNGTEVIAPGTTGDNTGVGTWHLSSCVVFPAGYKGNSGPGNISGTATAG
jgi:hypothetical protein